MSSRCSVCASDDFFEKQWILACRCNEDGTAIVRGTKLLTEGLHYWELKVLSPLYGTDVMVGIGTDGVDLYRYPNRFVSALGMDNQSWGFSYRGETQHNREVRCIHGGNFGRGDLVGCLLNLWHGSLNFFVNRRPIWGTRSFRIPPGEYYPMVSSTAARSGFRLVFAKSYAISLQVLACLSLQGAVTTPSVIFDLPGFPPGLQSMLKNNLPWLFCQARSSAGKLEKVESTTLSKNAATADCLDRLSSLLSQSPRIPSHHSLLPATSESVEDHPGPSTSTPSLVSDTTGSLSSTASHAASLPELSAWRVLDNLLKMASTEASPRFSSSPPTCCTLGRRGAGGETEQEGSSDAHPAKSLRLDGPVSGRQLQHPQPESPNSTDFVFAKPGNKAL
ncbi:hypothetical protein AAHC03_016794 [Spirometra sp. Aus1]